MIGVVAFVALAGLVTTQSIDVDFERSNDLSQYRTFAWHEDQEALENVANHLRLINAIQKTMMELGYRIDPRSPDLYVRYSVEQHTELQTNTSQKPSVWDPTDLQVTVDVSREELVSLKVQLTEADSHFVVWDVEGTYPMGTPDRSERQINEAVEDIFSKFPTEDEAKAEKKR